MQKVITSATSSRVIIRKMFSAKVTLKFQDSMTGVTGGLRRFQAEVYKIDSRGAKSPQSELGYIVPDSLFLVRPARTYSKGCKSLNRPDSGKVTAKGKGVRRETESEGSRRQTSGLTDRNPI